MTVPDASRHAHALWHRQGRGVATCTNGLYEVGIAKDEEDLEVFGASRVSFEEAFRHALGPTDPRD